MLMCVLFALSNLLFFCECLSLAVERQKTQENLTFSVTNSQDFVINFSCSNVFYWRKLQTRLFEFDIVQT